MARMKVVRAFSAGGVVYRYRRQRAKAAPAPGIGAPARRTEAAVPRAGALPLEQLALDDIEIVLVGRSYPGIWALPKGTPRAGEAVEEVAMREVSEETGLEVRIVAELGTIHYVFVRQRVRYEKEVQHFLMEPVGGDLSLHDAEYDLVSWFPISEAYRRMTYQNEVEIVRRAEEYLRQEAEEELSGR
jgi:ADP-ribose pyrophosphatase YjhB (NUDIX family)